MRIRNEVGTRHGFPSIRIGMHTGRATERSGDWFGSTVNTAARASGLATGGEVLATDTTRQAAGRVEGVDFQERGRHELRNVGEPALLCACIPQGERTPDDLPIDPVCRMAIASARAAARVTYQGVEYQFCSLQCARRFSTAPERYAGEGVPRGVGRFRTAAARFGDTTGSSTRTGPGWSRSALRSWRPPCEEETTSCSSAAYRRSTTPTLPSSSLWRALG